MQELDPKYNYEKNSGFDLYSIEDVAFGWYVKGLCISRTWLLILMDVRYKLDPKSISNTIMDFQY